MHYQLTHSQHSDMVYSRVSTEVADAVRSAINAGWDADKFRRCAAECWEEALRDDAKAAVKTLTR